MVVDNNSTDNTEKEIKKTDTNIYWKNNKVMEPH